MDWFKYLKRSGTPLRFDHRQGGYSISWRYKFTFPFLRPEGYTPDLQLQIFEEGFDSPAKSVGVRPFEFRLMLLTVPSAVGISTPTDIFADPAVLANLEKPQLWQVVPKEAVNQFLEANKRLFYPLFMKAIFEHRLEK